MRVILAFCAVLGTMLASCTALSGEIVGDELVEKGSDIKIQCILDLNVNSMQSVDDVRWYLDNLALASSKYTTINQNTSELTVVNATFGDAGNYACGFDSDTYWGKKTKVIYVGIPPGPAQNLTCTTHTMKEVLCQWKNSALDTNIRNRITFAYKQFGTESWNSLDIPLDDNSLDYSRDFTSKPGESYTINVTTHNAIGSATSDISFDTVEEVTVYPPQNVKALPEKEEDDYVLHVSWDAPGELPPRGYDSLKYRVDYESITTGSTVRVEAPPGFKWVKLAGLTPYTEYTINVTARSITADPIKTSLYWSKPAGITEHSSFGAPFGDPSNVTITSEVDSATEHQRIVELKWSHVPGYQWGSSSICYKVTLDPQDTSLLMDSHVETEEFPKTTFHGLNKYQTYKVSVQPYNEEGYGATSEFGNIIPDRTSAPSPPRNLNVSLESSSIMSISWDLPLHPNGIIHEYEVRVSGEAIFSSKNGTDQEATFKQRINSKTIAVSVDCTGLTKSGKSMQVWVSAVTKNYTHQLFQGNETTKMIHEVCKEPSGPNIIFIGIFIPTTIIVSCIIALILWNYFKDTCTEAPEPQFPSSITKNGQLKPITISPGPPPMEKEHFDVLKPKVNTISKNLDIEDSLQHTYLNPYHASPRNEPKPGMERNHSHDSGIPESPTENISMNFTNSAYEEDETTDKDDGLPCISGSIPEDTNALENLSWRNRCFSEGSQDSGSEVPPGPKSPDGVDLGPMSPSSPTEEYPKSDPYFKLTLLTDTDPFESPYCPHDLKISHGLAEETSGSKASDAESVDNYVKQCRLDDDSPTETNFASTPYTAMAPFSPPPITSSVPNGYIATELLPKSSHGIPQKQIPDNEPPEDYSKMTSTQGSSDNYLQHNAMTTNVPPVLPNDGYIKHDSFLFPKCTEYQDSYPDFNQNNMADGQAKLNHQGYIQHKTIPNNCL